MTRINRTNSSLIEINKKINFVFNGKKYFGFIGDTLASALLANNVLDKSYYNYAVGSASTYNAYNTYPLSEFNMMFKLSKDF